LCFSEIFWRQSSVFRDARKHHRPEFVGIGEFPSVVREFWVYELVMGTAFLVGGFAFPTDPRQGFANFLCFYNSASGSSHGELSI